MFDSVTLLNIIQTLLQFVLVSNNSFSLVVLCVFKDMKLFWSAWVKLETQRIHI